MVVMTSPDELLASRQNGGRGHTLKHVFCICLTCAFSPATLWRSVTAAAFAEAVVAEEVELLAILRAQNDSRDSPTHSGALALANMLRLFYSL